MPIRSQAPPSRPSTNTSADVEQLPEQLAALVGAHVERDAALVAIHLQMRRALVGHDLAEHVAEVVAAPGRLDLDHVGAEVAELLADDVAVEQHRHLEHPNPVEQTTHRHRACQISSDPPSTCNTVPVTYPLVIRNSTAWASSSGRPSRPSGSVDR